MLQTWGGGGGGGGGRLMGGMETYGSGVVGLWEGRWEGCLWQEGRLMGEIEAISNDVPLIINTCPKITDAILIQRKFALV